MKVGTDGVLLGAWADISLATNILDIGSGTGLLSLMCAQRNEFAIISAIEIDTKAYNQSLENFKNAPFKNQLTVQNVALQKFNPNIKFDHIICNPPYFVQNNKMIDSTRKTARQTTSLNFDELLFATNNLLTSNGKASFIIPFSEKESFLNKADSFSLKAKLITDVRGSVQTNLKRSLIELSYKETETIQTTLTIEKKRHQYTDAYIDLTKDFYLKM
jgi:tRNA1Val (adenine37-N6)-methyltransferase